MRLENTNVHRHNLALKNANLRRSRSLINRKFKQWNRSQNVRKFSSHSARKLNGNGEPLASKSDARIFLSLFPIAEFQREELANRKRRRRFSHVRYIQLCRGTIGERFVREIDGR